MDGFRERFVIDDPSLCYLAGNSLGRLPKATVERLRSVVADEWGGGLVRSWNEWIDLSIGVGDAIATLIGAPPGSVIVADSTTVNLHALVDAACSVRPGAIVVAETEFPTDRYVVEGVAAARGREVRRVVDGDVAVVVTSAVDFRSGEILDVPVGDAWTCLDLSHAAGVVPIDVTALGVELAVGCTYKHLHGGPGAPAFLYVRPDLQPQLRRPQWGWFAQRDQFAMGPAFDPVDGIGRFLAGTPAVLGLAAVEEGVRLVAEAGIDAIRARSQALTAAARSLVAAQLEPFGVGWASPEDLTRIGGHVCLSHAAAVAVGVAARAVGVVPDVRPPDRIRLGLSPLSTSFEELTEGVERLAGVLTAGVDVGVERPRVT